MAAGSRIGTAGVVSYRLARQRAIDSVLQGRRDREDVCDAQAELRRVAVHHAHGLAEACPICDSDQLGV
ncbi:MAG: DUF5318 domain-containing protein, partial [Acidimicrobiia bacterium]|nr:DUF5318 domain-containing protein [Acidimicrobiia bacterium]